jgi:anti-sigma factor RsiW
MNRKTHAPLSEEEIHALLDEQVSSSAKAALEIRLSTDPAAQATLLKWQQQRLALKQLYQDVIHEPVPSNLTNTVIPLPIPKDPIAWARWGGMAASVLLSFGVGWVAHSAWLHQGADNNQSQRLAAVSVNQRFAHQAAVAHVVYSPEVRHPVEVAASEQDHLVKWLSKRLNKPLQVPKLTELGFELVGGRLLPGEPGARAQFMFQNVDGLRITLYLGAVDPAAGGGDARETAFNFLDDGAIPSFYWIDHGFGYALAGALPRNELLKVAEAVYQQL